MNKLFKYSQQIITGLVLIAAAGGVAFAMPGWSISSLTSGFIRAYWHSDPYSVEHSNQRRTFFYGYGWSGLNQEWGYGYGYDANTDETTGHIRAEYGFEGTEGPVTIESVVTDKTTATITYSTNYLARIISGYGTGLPLSQSNVIYVHTDADFNSGGRVWEITGLTCDTTYYYTLRAKDAADNAWPIEDSFTTDQCHDTTITGSVPSTLLDNKSQPNQSQSHNPRGLRLPAITLALGSLGQDVKDLQVLLNFFGTFLASDGAGSPGEETQTFGTRTKAALMRFQSTFGLGIDGIYGQETYDAMEGFLR